MSGESPSVGVAMRRCRCKCRKWLFAQFFFFRPAIVTSPVSRFFFFFFFFDGGTGCATCIKQSDASQSVNK